MFKPRGVIEGFYGRPWSWAERHSMLDFMAEQGFDTYLYAPKNDPIHRNRWREPYTSVEWSEFGQLAEHARQLGITLVFGLSALGFRYRHQADLRVLRAKLREALGRGIHAFALLLDDQPAQLTGKGDVARFGTLAQAQAWLVNTLAAQTDGSFLFAPTEYHGAGDSTYLRELGATLRPDIQVFWTGRDICSPSISAADLRAVTAALRRMPTLWDNVPVNDLDMAYDPHLGPLTGRAANLGQHTAGYFAAAGPLAEASKVALHTVAAYLRAPAAYDPAWAAREAALALTGTVQDADALLRLSDLARRGPLYPDKALHHTLWPALDAFWAARGGPPPQAGGELKGRPPRQAVLPSEAPLRRAAADLERAAETLAHLKNLELRRDVAPWTQKLAGWARVLKYALAALDHPHDTRAREYVLEELALVRANPHWVAGDTFDHFARRCVWAAEAHSKQAGADQRTRLSTLLL